MPVVNPVYSITDKDLTEFESQTRAALQDLTDMAPLGKNGKKVALPGIRACMKLLSMYASVRASYAKEAEPDPEVELEQVEENLRKNQEWLESSKTNGKIGIAAKESVRKGILKLETRKAELLEQISKSTSEPEPTDAPVEVAF